MQTRNVPVPGPRYWAAISVASVFGANMGDFFAHYLHLGHTGGLLPLALIFGSILLLERRSGGRSELFYWAAIVTLRTGATNLADLMTHDLRLGDGWVITGLAALFAAILLIDRWLSGAARSPVAALPQTNARYWAAMLVAGTLGTAIGDTTADDTGLGVVGASVLLAAVTAGMFGLQARQGPANKLLYWGTILAVRSAGTTIGDTLAHALGLAVSTAGTGLVLLGFLLVTGRESITTPESLQRDRA